MLARTTTLLACGFAALFSNAFAAEPFELQLRSRIETSDGSGRYHTITKPESWDPQKTAIIVCDVWDSHHSRNAARRTGELAPHIDELVKAVRTAGGTVLHCPSDCMESYKDHPARLAAQQVPKAKVLPPEIGKWCYSIPNEERGEYPLDQSDGGGDDDPKLQAAWLKELEANGRKPAAPWIKQHEAIAIEPGDYVTDKGDEVWSILEAKGIDNILMTGVHTNMCVLGRPFGLRRLASNGKNVVLVRDLTDTMYNPAMRPFVNHFTGNDLIVEHIEKFVCPTVTSDQIVGGESFVFKDDDRPHVAIVMSEPEYGTEKTLPAFARRHLGRHFKVSLVFGDDKDGNDLPGLEVLKDADVLLLSMRRRALRPEQMTLIRDFIAAGKPVVGIRTSSHALSLRGKEPPEGRVTWESFDADVFGGNYSNHYGTGPVTSVAIAEGAQGNPLLRGVEMPFESVGSLYQVKPLKGSATPLLVGAIPSKPAEPVAYTNKTIFDGKAFYTSLGHEKDFEHASFRRLLFNALLSAAEKEIPKTMPDADAEGEKAGGGEGETEGQRDAQKTPRIQSPSPLGRGVRGEGLPSRVDVSFTAPRATTSHSQATIGINPTPSPLAPLPRERGTVGESQLADDISFVSRLSPSPASPDPDSNDPERPYTEADDLTLELVLSEPDIAQPVFMDFDERGRLWVVQYLQYPNPAGLTMLSKDKFWRAVYDKVPAAPPHHVKGADKITIHEDTDGDGRFDAQKTFVDGLSIVTSFARGRGGVWVLNPPYLLFYPDRDNDDVPDADPEVHLAGFGLEDTHSVANSLRFGPDGWLYACQGSTVSGHVTRPGTTDKPVATMGQLIWRYHPETREYEVFAEGGGNAFGLEIDSAGNIYSGHNGGDTRGFHYIQGGYYRKGFEKHGPLSNPHAYGFFEPMGHAKVPRFTHNFVIYEGDALPDSYQGKLFGVEPLQGQVTLTEITSVGATFETQDLDRIVKTEDGTRFRPVHITTGPDGAIYVADFHEQYIAHRDHFEGRIAKETGRVYRLKARPDQTPLSLGRGAGGEGGSDARIVESRRGTARDTSEKKQLQPQGNPSPLTPLPRERGTSQELVSLLDHPNRWQRQTALRVIAERNDGSFVPTLRRELFEGETKHPLERLWAISQLGRLDDATTFKALDHSDPLVRSWTVRLACDDHSVSPTVAAKLQLLAAAEPDVRVRVQLACSARRLPADDCLALVVELVKHDEDAADKFLPLSLWWAVEAKCSSDADAVAAFASDMELWSHPLARDVLAERLMRRFASGDRADLARCATLLAAAPDDDLRKRYLAGFEAAFRGRAVTALPDALVTALASAGPIPLSLRLRQGDKEAVTEALGKLTAGTGDVASRVELVTLLGEVQPEGALPLFLSLFDADDAQLRSAALSALANYDDSSVADRLLKALPQRPSSEQIAILSVLVSRADWSRRLIATIRTGDVPKEIVPSDLARRFALHGDESLIAAATELWPAALASQPQSAGDVHALHDSILASAGDPYRGKRLFATACGRCHRLFGDGGDVGPDLTSDPRNDLSRLLGAVVAPSAEIREGFENYVAVTSDGRVVSGLLVDQDEHVVVLREADGRAVLLQRDEVEDLVKQQKSLMPDGLLDRMPADEVRDLFAYLRSSQPLNE